jgi:hypothetical protein
MGKLKKPKSERFLKIPQKLIESHAYRALGWTSRCLFIDLRSKYNGYNNGNINASLASLSAQGWVSSATLSKCLRQLESVGLIQKTRQTVGVENGSKMCNLYRFTDLPVLEHPKQGIAARGETNDYLFIKSLMAAKELINSATSKKNTLQFLNRNDSKNEGSKVKIGSKFEDAHADCSSSFEGCKQTYTGKISNQSSAYMHSS